jgi:pimeloyl-ACP methyl ester carboxylesterase
MPHASIHGARLFYREAGGGPPLLLIHGAGPDSRGWGATFDDLASDYRVIALDRRGFGQSVDQRLVDWQGHAGDAAALLRELSAAPAVVVGWSGGGIVALHLAVHHPELVSALVLIETALRGKRHMTASLAVAFARARLHRALGQERKATETLLRWALGSTAEQSTWDRDDYPQERRESSLANSRGIWNDIDSGDGSDLSTETLRAIACPVTCVRGDRSQPWFARTTKRIPKLIPRAHVRVIQDTNHAFTFHRPRELAQAIRDVAATAATVSFLPWAASQSAASGLRYVHAAK